jgi:hypothetical protein
MCHILGGTLVEIETAAENAFLASMAINFNGKRNEYIFGHIFIIFSTKTYIINHTDIAHYVNMMAVLSHKLYF